MLNSLGRRCTRSGGTVELVLLVDLLPGLLPVVGVLAVPGEHVADALGVLALGGNALQAGLDDLHRVVSKKAAAYMPPMNWPP